MATTYGSAPVAHAVCRLQAARRLLAGTRLSAQQNKDVLPGSCIDLDNPCVDDSGGKTLVNPDGSDSSYLKKRLFILGELVAGKGTTGQFIATVQIARLRQTRHG
jgi:hypothetical protein